MKWLAAAIAALSLVGCTKSTTTPSASTSTKTTDTFTGTVAVKGTDSHTFSVAASGEVDVTLTTANPSVPLGLMVGTSSGSDCVAVAGGSAVVSPGATAQLSGVMSPASYCVAVFDVGTDTQSVSYTVTVAHF
jgi:hypothetical protein